MRNCFLFSSVKSTPKYLPKVSDPFRKSTATSKTSPYYNHPVFKIGNSDSYNSDNIKIYDKNNLDNIIPDKKIILSPLLEKINHDINQLYKNFLYYVSFVLLSGDIDKCDQKNTIDKIIISSYLPLSIIIIGVGDHDFTEMNTFFNKEHKSSSRGIPRNKNNVIFTTIKSHSSTSEAISYCLKELSKQIIEFYQLIKYSPQNTEIINIENLKASQEIFGSVLNEEIIKEKDEKKDTNAIDMNKSNTSINSNNNYTNTGTPGDTPNHKNMYILKHKNTNFVLNDEYINHITCSTTRLIKRIWQKTTPPGMGTICKQTKV